MRAVALWVLAGTGCASSGPPPAPPPPTPQLPMTLAVRTCADAAIGIERVTRGLRPPDRDVLVPVQQRCRDEAWSREAIRCFAKMGGPTKATSDELATCTRLLPAEQRGALLADVTGTAGADGEVGEIVAKLGALKVGILTCDRFVAAVANVMTCRAMELETRVRLGNETADFWSLSTGSLTIEAKARIAEACGESLHALEQQAADVGCMP